MLFRDFFNMRYFVIAEDEKRQNLTAKLRYLPVSRRALRQVRMETLRLGIIFEKNVQITGMVIK